MLKIMNFLEHSGSFQEEDEMEVEITAEMRERVKQALGDAAVKSDDEGDEVR